MNSEDLYENYFSLIAIFYDKTSEHNYRNCKKKRGWGFARGLQKHVLTFDFWNHPTSAVVLLAVSFTSSTVTVCLLACL